jgi:hypothetical protein
MESTIMKSYMRGANLRRWLKRPDCPEVIRQFKRLFDQAFTPKKPRENILQNTSKSKQLEHAYYTYNSIIFSRSSTHLGNSLVLFYPTPSSTTPVAGSIQKIETSGPKRTSLSSVKPRFRLQHTTLFVDTPHFLQQFIPRRWTMVQKSGFVRSR